MMTQHQIVALDQQNTCKGRFLPPFNSAFMLRDRIYYHNKDIWMNSAEFMVGGLQLNTNGAPAVEQDATFSESLGWPTFPSIWRTIFQTTNKQL